MNNFENDKAAVNEPTPPAEPAEGQAGLDQELAALLEQLNPALHPVARRWGKDLFLFCNTTGVLGASFVDMKGAFGLALQTISGAPSKLPIAKEVAERAARSMAMAENLTNELATSLAAARGWSLEDIRECQADIGRAVALTQATTGASGLILAH